MCLLWATPTSLCNSSPSVQPPYKISTCPRELAGFGFALHLFGLPSLQAERDCGQPWHSQLSWEAGENGQQNCTHRTVIPGELQHIVMPSVSGRTASPKSGENLDKSAKRVTASSGDCATHYWKDYVPRAVAKTHPHTPLCSSSQQINILAADRVLSSASRNTP